MTTLRKQQGSEIAARCVWRCTFMWGHGNRKGVFNKFKNPHNCFIPVFTAVMWVFSRLKPT